jgi:colanic acid/amylovoran biosynthesis protein
VNILILNTHSVLNSGDAAIVVAEVRLLGEYLGDARIAVTSRTPAVDRGFYERLGVRVLPPLFPAPSVFATRREALFGCARGVASVRDKRRLFAAVRDADLVISSGGGYFFSTRRGFPGPMFWQALAHVGLAQRMGKPIVFAPQSVGPFANRLAARAMRRLLSHVSVRAILLREPRSLACVHELIGGGPAASRTFLCPDLAFLLEADAPRGGAAAAPAQRRPVLAVTVRDWLFADRSSAAGRAAARSSYLVTVADACVHFHRRSSGSVRILPHSRGPGQLEDDRPISRELAGSLRGRIPDECVSLLDLAGDDSPQQVMAALADADLVLASRLHSAILAMAAGRPAIVLGYQPKSEGTMALLGLERLCLPMDGLDLSRLAQLIEEVLDNPERFAAERVRPAVASARAEIGARMHAALTPFRPGEEP